MSNTNAGKIVDGLGKACPLPVVLTKKEMDLGEETILTKVDNKIAVENLKRLGDSGGYRVEVQQEDGIYQVVFTKICKACEEFLDGLNAEEEGPSAAVMEKGAEEAAEARTSHRQPNDISGQYAVFIGRETIGQGDDELGRNLMRMFLYTLTESDELPAYILLMNGGVKLAVEDDQAIDHLKLLKEKGVTILVCGTCLNYFGLTDYLKAGTVSNMYDIVCAMKNAAKLISF